MKDITCSIANQTNYPFVLPKLPYDAEALEPYMSAKTFSFHHGKHHNAYVVKLNELIADLPLKNKSLEEIILETHKDSNKIAIFNNAAQVWNHTFFWYCMKKGGGGNPTGKIADMIVENFGTYDKFREEFKNNGIGQFGSGWVWLVLTKENKLQIRKTPNAELPMIHGEKALLTADVWEHAYYLDYQNARPNFLDVFLSNLVNWDFVNSNLQ